MDRYFRLILTYAVLAIVWPCGGFAATSSWAGSQDSNFDNAANWFGGMPTDVAEFNSAQPTAITLGINSHDELGSTNLNGLTFNPGAAAYTITVPGGGGNFLEFFLKGEGIKNNSSVTQTIHNHGGLTIFENASSAGNATFLNDKSDDGYDWGYTSFDSSSTADHATLVNNYGIVDMNGTSTLANATVTNVNGGVLFSNYSSAGSAHVDNLLSGGMRFSDHASADQSTLSFSSGTGVNFDGLATSSSANITNRGEVLFFDSTTAAGATITNFNTGVTRFRNAADAGSAHIVNMGAGTSIVFSDSSTASNAALQNGGGLIRFEGNAKGGSATLANTSGGVLSLDGLASDGLSLASVSGDGSVVLSSKTLTLGNLNTDSYISGVMSGLGGSLVKDGTGTLTMGGANTYTGSTVVNRGLLRTSAANALSARSAISLANASGVALDLNSSDQHIGSLSGGGTAGGSVFLTNATLTTGMDNTNTTYAGSLSGSGSLIKVGTGTFNLSGVNTYTGGTALNGGTLAIYSDQNLGAGQGSLSFNGGTLHPLTDLASARSVTFNAAGGILDTGSSTLTLSGGINGVGGLTKQGRGTLVLAGTSTYAGPTELGAGTLRAGRALTFSKSSAITLANIAGVTLDLNNFDQSVGSLAGGGSAGGQILLGSATLTTGFDNRDTAFAGAISGSGSLVKTGTGTFTLVGNSTYTGPTIINGGVLALTGPVSTAHDVDSHAARSISGNLILNQGTLKSAAAGFAKIVVTGDYVQTGGTLDLRLGGGASLGQFDQLVVGGAAHLGGTLQLDLTGGSFVPGAGRTFTIIQSTAITGDFSVINGSAGLGLTFNSVTGGLGVIVSQNDFAPLAATDNQRSVAASIDRFSRTAQGSLSNVVGSLNGLASGQIPAALSELSPQRYEMYGDVAFQSASFTAEELHNHLARSRSGVQGLDMAGMKPQAAGSPEAILADASLSDGFDEALPPERVAQRPADPSESLFAISSKLGAFVSANGLISTQRATQDLQKSSFRTGGTMGGLDYRLGDRFTAGALLGYTHTELDLDQECSSAKIEGFAPGIYGSYVDEGTYVTTLLSWGRNTYKASRRIVFGNFNEAAQSSTRGNQMMAGLNAGTGYSVGPFVLGPTAGLTYLKLKVDGFKETGSSANLQVGDQTSDSLQTLLGGHADHSFRWMHRSWSSSLHAAWRHEYLNNSQPLHAAFSQSGSPFTVHATAGQKNSVLGGLHLNLQMSKSLSFSGSYMAEKTPTRFFAQGLQGSCTLRF